MSNRTYLKKSILLCRESKGNGVPVKFIIDKGISDTGSFSLCYRAHREDSGQGVLKEFYPVNAYGLERDRHGQLVCTPEFESSMEQFRKDREEYLKAYEILLEAKQKDQKQVLATFIPEFEIYYGCDEAGNAIGTTYIWTPTPESVTFEKVCEEIHTMPSRRPEYRLVNALKSIQTLAKCICFLHSAGIIHRDIKPSNFGFMVRDKEVLTEALTLFDINSIYNIFGPEEKIMGTEYYMEPEKQEDPSNQTDIYSIGATLFHAIIVNEEVKEQGYHYLPEYYDRLGEMVDSSALIQASEDTRHPRLRHILTSILRKCLADRKNRYKRCEDLIKDLDTALFYLLPAEFAKKVKSGQTWVLKDVEKSLDANREKNSFLAMQYHLYEYPLYICDPGEGNPLNVLIIGLGNYGQKFLDACLQNGQMRNRSLDVTVVSREAADREIYLRERPELGSFFNIDCSDSEPSGIRAEEGIQPDSQKIEDSYGDIHFQSRSLDLEDRKALSDVLREILLEYYMQKENPYIFIALGEDSKNREAAEVIRDAAADLSEKERGLDCFISYALEDENSPAVSGPGIRPVYINRDISQSESYQDIERMAFNTHLVWEKNLNIDFSEIRKKFRKPYNHDSSVSSVLSLKYKLYSMGIDLKEMTAGQAAEAFLKKTDNKGGSKLKDELIWIEHRRWVTEKLCLGWRTRSLDECEGGVTRDERAKNHICLRKSRPDQKLTREYANHNYKKWDTASRNELKKLDDLDYMSVDLHRRFKRKAGEARNQNVLTGDSITALRSLIEGKRKSFIAFQEWFNCLKDIWAGDIPKVRLYKGLKDAFLKAVEEELSKEEKKAVMQHTAAFEMLFDPIRYSMEYHDWKQEDTAFIDHIPFILTYSEKSCLVIPFQPGNGSNTEKFDNVAAATVINPASILYLYQAKKKDDIEALLTAIPYISEYLRKKKIRAKVDFFLLAEGNRVSFQEELKNKIKQIKQLGGGQIRDVKYINGDRKNKLEELEKELKKRSKNKDFFALEENNSGLSEYLLGAGTYDKFSSYRFDAGSMKFEVMKDCAMLGYIRKRPYISVMDMASIRLSSSQSSGKPEFYSDYRNLWDVYNRNIWAWKAMCRILSDYAKKNDQMETFSKNSATVKTQPDVYHYILPSSCRKSAEKILKIMQENDILDGQSTIKPWSSDACRVTIADYRNYKQKYDKFFASVYKLMQDESLMVSFDAKAQTVRAVFDDLEVREAEITGNQRSDIKKLLSDFQTRGYIHNLTISADKVCFTYATSQIKELLSTEGKMLEVYTYHKIKETGEFDDVVSSFELEWENAAVKNEFDCILTKGFRSLFVECKARTDLDQDFYYKLDTLTRCFGVNAKAVLVADTRENSQRNGITNTVQRERGNLLDSNIITIWQKDEIDDIGNTLLKVLDGTYQSR